MGTWFSDKYAEGTIGHRFYAGCQNVDTVESVAAEHARELFGAPYAYAQPHSGIDANLVAFWSILAHRVEGPGLEKLGAKNVNDLTDERVGEAAPRARQPAPARHVAGRRRPPDPRLPAQHQRQDVPPAAVRHRPGDRAARLRRGRGQGPRVQAAGAGRRLLGVPAPGQLREDARDRRRGRRDADGRHGPLRRAGGRQGLHRRRGPGAARAHHHDDHAQVAARPARRPGAGAGGVRAVGRPRLPDGPRRPALAHDGRQGGRPGRGPAGLVPHLRAEHRGQRQVARRRLPEPRRHPGHRRHRQPHRAARRVVVRADRPPGRVGPARRRRRHQPQLGPARPQRRLVHLRHPARHAGAHDPRLRPRRVRPRSPS